MSSLAGAVFFFLVFFWLLLLFVAIRRSNRCVLAAINSVAVPLRAMVFLRKDGNVRKRIFFTKKRPGQQALVTYPIATLLCTSHG